MTEKEREKKDPSYLGSQFLRQLTRHGHFSETRTQTQSNSHGAKSSSNRMPSVMVEFAVEGVYMCYTAQSRFKV